MIYKTFGNVVKPMTVSPRGEKSYNSFHSLVEHPHFTGKESHPEVVYLAPHGLSSRLKLTQNPDVDYDATGQLKE